MAGRLHSIQPSDREPVNYTHFSEWFASDLADDASEEEKLKAFDDSFVSSKVTELESVLASWAQTVGVPLLDMDGFDNLDHMVRTVGWDNTINLVVYAILCAGFDVYVGSDFIEIYNRTDWE